MTSVLGYRLTEALSLLDSESRTVFVQEVRSRKGSEGDDCRVIRERYIDNVAILTYSAFSTKLIQS